MVSVEIVVEVFVLGVSFTSVVSVVSVLEVSVVSDSVVSFVSVGVALNTGYNVMFPLIISVSPTL